MVSHLAAVAASKGLLFEVQSRPTPKPGPGELLIAVKSVALNPADHLMRSGLFMPDQPTVIGFDLSGLVIEAGDNAPAELFLPGTTRVAAYADFFFKAFDADHGAFQERCVVPWQHAVVLPEGISWNDAATLPVAVEVALNAWDILGVLPVSKDSGPAASTGKGNGKKEALLIWGASSSVGTMGVQTGRIIRDDSGSSFAAVYATASAANHEYISTLGADRVFDYKDPQVVESIVAAAKEDGVRIRHCFLAMGQLAPCQAVLKAFVGDGQVEDDQKAKIGSAPPVPEDAEQVNGVETAFLLPSMDETERLAQYEFWMTTYLGKALANGTIKPSPEAKVVGKGLEAINIGLDELKNGVSCTKLVIEVAE